MARPVSACIVPLLLLAEGCGARRSIVPENYARSFVEVRGCRYTDYHERPSLRSELGIYGIRVLVNPESARA